MGKTMETVRQAFFNDCPPCTIVDGNIPQRKVEYVNVNAQVLKVLEDICWISGWSLGMHEVEAVDDEALERRLYRIQCPGCCSGSWSMLWLYTQCFVMTHTRQLYWRRISLSGR